MKLKKIIRKILKEDENKFGIGKKVKFNKTLYNKAGRDIGTNGGVIVDIKNYSDGKFYIVRIKGKKYQLPEKYLK